MEIQRRLMEGFVLEREKTNDFPFIRGLKALLFTRDVVVRVEHANPPLRRNLGNRAFIVIHV